MVELMPRARVIPVAAPAPRSVTILGATGSIGASTVDLLKRHRDRYRVEAISAKRNARALARIARELDARFAAIADEDAYADLKEDLAGTAIEAGAGRAAVLVGAHRVGRTVPYLVQGGDPSRHARAGAQAPELVDGPQGHDRFGHADEQGPRAGGGASLVRHGIGADRGAGASAVGGSWAGRVS